MSPSATAGLSVITAVPVMATDSVVGRSVARGAGTDTTSYPQEDPPSHGDPPTPQKDPPSPRDLLTPPRGPRSPHGQPPEYTQSVGFFFSTYVGFWLCIMYMYKRGGVGVNKGLGATH